MVVLPLALNVALDCFGACSPQRDGLEKMDWIRFHWLSFRNRGHRVRYQSPADTAEAFALGLPRIHYKDVAQCCIHIHTNARMYTHTHHPSIHILLCFDDTSRVWRCWPTS